METKFNKQLPIFWKGNLCQLIKWETLTFGGELKAKIKGKFITININDLTN